MAIEEKLKALILTRYRSVREFTQACNIPYSTVTSIFKRGVSNAGVSTVIKVCQALNISADELAAGRITPVSDAPQTARIEDMITALQIQLQNTRGLTLNDEPATDAVVSNLVNSLDVLIEIEKRNNRGNT